MNLSKEQLNLYTSLFKGRKDVFAERWEFKDKKGYSPVKTVNDTYKPFTVDDLRSHMIGRKTIGLYPLLKNNTSYFLAVDFDKGNWNEESLMFISKCNDYGLNSYLEKFRTGNGGHVWFFFDQKVQAYKSRNVFSKILLVCFNKASFKNNS